MKIIFYIIAFYSLYASGAEVISLGPDCQAAYYLRKYNLRNKAFPLDWNTSYNFKSVCSLINNNFDFFLDKKYLIRKGNGILNTLYNTRFVHDFPTMNHATIANENENWGTVVSNYLIHLDKVQKKYYPRITRLYNALQSNELILFFRPFILPSEATFFVSLIQEKYPQCNFELVVIHGHSQYHTKWNLPHIKDFYATKRVPHLNNWWHDSEWIKVFNELNLPIQQCSNKEIDILYNYGGHICIETD